MEKNKIAIVGYGNVSARVSEKLALLDAQIKIVDCNDEHLKHLERTGRSSRVFVPIIPPDIPELYALPITRAT